MSKNILAVAALLCSMCLASAHAADQAKTPAANEIDADVWNVIVDTVAKHDIVRMGSTYLPDAVLVTPKETKTIAKTLEKWGQDMVAAQAKGEIDTVAFRFSHRQDGADTAFETGIFKYSVMDKSGTTKAYYYPFEQLLIKKNGKWRIVMERQFAQVTQVEWDKLPPN
jgi:ketosteroid isomerase-like protein